MKPINVLFLCTANACRSQMAEAMLRNLGQGRFIAHSAGSHPAGFVHPLCIAALVDLGFPVGNPRSKSWDEFTGTRFEVVITLCDHAAAQTCPVWPGSPISTHWSLPDPVTHEGSRPERLDQAVGVAKLLREKLKRFVALDFDRLAGEVLQRQIDSLAWVKAPLTDD